MAPDLRWINEIVTSLNDKQFQFGPFLVAKKFLVRIHQKGKTRYLLQSIVMESVYLRYSDKNITVYSNLISSPFSVAAISTLGFKVWNVTSVIGDRLYPFDIFVWCGIGFELPPISLVT